MVTTLEDLRVEIAILAGEIRETNSIMKAHVLDDAKFHAAMEHRVGDHGERLRQQEATLQAHQAGHKQVRMIGGAMLALGTLVAAVGDKMAAFFSWIK